MQEEAFYKALVEKQCEVGMGVDKCFSVTAQGTQEMTHK